VDSTAPVAVASTSPAVAALVIWTARLRTSRVVKFRASVSRAFRAVALIALAAAPVDSAATASVAAGDLGVVALVALAGAAAEDFAAAEVAGSEADGKN
jgi:hypothetical protein